MKKVIALFALFALLTLAYPEEQKYEEFLGNFKFVYKIGGMKFTDYITITQVTGKGKISGKWTYYGTRIHGRIVGDVAYVTDEGCDFFLDGWLYSPYSKKAWHMSCCALYNDFDTSFEKMKAFWRPALDSPGFDEPQILNPYVTMKQYKAHAWLKNPWED